MFDKKFETPHVKGSSFSAVTNCFRQRMGEAEMKKVIERLPEEMAKLARSGLLIPSSWYPLEWYKTLLHAMADVTGQGPLFIREVAREAIKLLLQGPYRIFLGILTPSFLLRTTARGYTTLNSHGEIEIIDVQKNFCRIAWRACPGFDRHLWEDQFGAAIGGLEAVGAKEVRLHVISGGTDCDDAEIELFWYR